MEEDLGDYDASEDTTALYGQVELLLGDNLTFLGGARWERTEFDYRANELVFDDDGDIVAVNPTSGSSENDEILPSAHLRWALDEETNVRFAFTRSLARPNYEDLAPFSLILEEDGEIQRGNPNLDITTAWNYDIMWERYLSTVGIVSAGVFYKQIEDNIFFFTAEEDRNGDTFDVIQPRNGDSAEVIGLEVAYQNRFRNLPAPWDGLGLYFNATFIDSEAAIPERDDTLFPGQADTVYNLSLSYEKYGFSGRVSLNYHSEYLSEVGGDEASDIFIDERTQLDLSFSQQVTSKVRLYLDVLNLTDEPFRVYEGSEDRPIQEEYYSWWGTFGVKIDL
ncbi:MAG: TonB-dependent receptor [Acidobacteriota bacterium]